MYDLILVRYRSIDACELIVYIILACYRLCTCTSNLPDDLLQVQHQVHPSLVAKEDALNYIESLIISLLGTLCAAQPHSVQDVMERVNKTFPDPIDKWANRDASIALEKGKKNSSIVLPVEKIHQYLVKVIPDLKIE